MGCDVHIHSEVKINGRWHHYDQPNCDRDYALFEKMAGVRGDAENAIAPPRGVPGDATDMTRFDCAHWGLDGHSHSWLSAEEIAQLADWYAAEYPEHRFPKWERWLFGNPYSSFMKYPDDRVDGVEDVRFIFWFDN